MKWQTVLDWLFRIGVYWGVRVNVPPEFIEFGRLHDGQLIRKQELSLNTKDELTEWLLEECDGPWRIKAQYSTRTVKAYMSFARVDDAVMFRLMMR